MRKFRWRLQRVLDITNERQRALKAELFSIAREIVKVRQEMAHRQALIRTLLADLAARTLQDRLPEQTIVVGCAAAEERILRRLRGRMTDLEARRDARTREFLRVRGTRRTLERMREEARTAFLREEEKRQQKQFDEGSHIAFARKQRSRTSGAPA